MITYPPLYLVDTTHQMNPRYATFNWTQNNSIKDTTVRITSVFITGSSTTLNVTGGIQNFLKGDVHDGKFNMSIFTHVTKDRTSSNSQIQMTDIKKNV